jgi:hypothetical protein
MNANKTIPFSYFEGACILAVLFMTLRAAIPLFDRFALFWGIIQVAALADALLIYHIPRKAQATNIVLRLYVLFTFLLNTYMYYNAENQYGFKNYRRFYPYNSILNKHVDSERRTKQLYTR